MSDYSSSPSRPGSPVGPLPDLSQSITRPFRFNWDASRLRGPGSVSETTEGRGGEYLTAIPRVDIPNTSVTNLPLTALPQQWSSSTQGFNAISNVLNNPHKGQAPPKAHSSLPSVPPAELPRVKRKDFDSYIRAIAPEWERFVKITQLSHDGAHLDGPSTPRASSEIPFTPRTPRINKLLTPLDTVPNVFFQPDFDLGTSRTFDAVTERTKGDEEASDPSSLSYSLPLLERLSHHTDTIEQHLVREISLRSTSFFAALTNLQDLQTESEACLDRISKLRGLLKNVDENGAKRGLQIVRKEIRLLNLATTGEGIRELGAIVEMTGVARSLVGAGQWGEALDVIDSIEALWEPSAIDVPVPHKTSPESGSKKSAASSVPLSSLNAFASLPSHLRALTMEITSSLTTDLVNTLKLDLLDRVTADSEFSEPTSNMNLTLKDRLRPSLQGLLRTKGIREATVSWREVVTKEVRGIIKRHLPSFDPDEEDKSLKGVARHVVQVYNSGVLCGLPSLLRPKSHAEFLSIISQVYKSLLNGIEGLQIQNSILINILESQQWDLPSLQEELSDIVSSAADLSNKLVAKVVGYRSEQHAQLDLPSFLVFFNESWGFVIKCEVICRRMIMGLRGVILGQAKLFLQSFHQARINQSAKLVEDEQWNQIEVSPALQHTADVLVDSAVRDSPDLILGCSPTSRAPPSSSPNGTTSSTPGKLNGSSGSSAKYIRIEERPYFCVSATGAVLDLLLDYLKLVVNLSMLNTDTMSRIIEFLKAFNSRTCQVVLGAGAMRSAGLRNITAKHLALASQSLSIMVVLIPYVRETFRRHLSPNQAVMLIEFDKLKRDFQEHQNEIHSKLIAIMGDRITAHIKSLQASPVIIQLHPQSTDWEIPRQGDGANDYMQLLVKETVTLHKVLSRYLSAPIVEFVMSEVFAAINHRLSEEYNRIECKVKKRRTGVMLADAQFLHQKLSVLKNVGAPTNMLETLVAEKSVPRKSALSNLRLAATPNERIKGLLSRKDSIKPDKPLPAPAQTTSSSSGLTPPLPQTILADENSDQVVPPPRGSSRSAALPVRVEGSGTISVSAGDDSADNNIAHNGEPPRDAGGIPSSALLPNALEEPSDGSCNGQLPPLPS
ncbi:Vps54-like protein-domain-containing protein [Melanogaster broomeanus]|nr:Vps54-like protein-domain-containing protein [Melanogaster broomeanus]